MSAAVAVDVLRRADQAASLFSHPLRLKLLEQLIEPDSASGLARRLGVPRQVLNYHLKALEGAGLLQFVAERPRGGLKERAVAGGGLIVFDQPRGDGGRRARPEAAAGPVFLGVSGRGGGAGRPRPGNPARPGRSRGQDGWRHSRWKPRCGLPARLTATHSLASWQRKWRSWPCGITTSGRRRGVCSDSCWVRTRRSQRPIEEAAAEAASLPIEEPRP